MLCYHKNMNMRNAIWRNRATAILGGLVFLLALFSGLPGRFDRMIYLALGLIVMLLGFAGSRSRGSNVTPVPNVPPVEMSSNESKDKVEA